MNGVFGQDRGGLFGGVFDMLVVVAFVTVVAVGRSGSGFHWTEIDLFFTDRIIIFCHRASYYHIDVDSESHECVDHLGTFK